MSRWKQLPASLDPRVRQLVVQLRRVKDHSGLSLHGLASRTGYSRSSWNRYLNGRALPPQQAVAALARACDADPARLLALREVAAGGPGPQQAAGRDEEGPDTERADTERADGARRGRRRWVVGFVAAVVVVLATVTALLLAAPWNGDDGQGSASENVSGKGEFVFQSGKDHPCKVHRDADGLLYAGYSRTRTALIGPQSAQWPVVEAQCLLRHQGFPPGLADGMYGTRTERAVLRLQQASHLPVDGVVGEDTWRVLRK